MRAVVEVADGLLVELLRVPAPMVRVRVRVSFAFLRPWLGLGLASRSCAQRRLGVGSVWARCGMVARAD